MRYIFSQCMYAAVNSYNSDLHIIHFGVLEGSVLISKLFYLYINYLLSSIPAYIYNCADVCPTDGDIHFMRQLLHN